MSGWGQTRKYSPRANVFRFPPESGLNSGIAPCPKRAMCGRLRVGKTNLHVAGLVGAAMCSALGAVRMTAGHNALRGSGPDQQQAFSEPVGMPQPCQEPTLRDDCCWRKAVVSQANRKQLRWTVHSDLNRLPTAGRLWCAYVALRVFVDCYRPIAPAGRRAGCAGS
jgi:hypothetical protein